jgi:hypothetical protein
MNGSQHCELVEKTVKEIRSLCLTGKGTKDISKRKVSAEKKKRVRYLIAKSKLNPYKICAILGVSIDTFYTIKIEE